MIGILMAGGSGTRFYPATISINKHLFPVYDKPMIYYPLSVLMLLKIKKILIIVSEDQYQNFYKALGDGSNFGVSLKYIIQNKPKGISDCFNLCKEFILEKKVCLILGDNFFYGQDFTNILLSAKRKLNGCTIFGYNIANPKDFAVVSFDKSGSIKSIEEKPKSPQSNIAVTGLYMFDETVLKKFSKIKPSDRGELEITSIISQYINNNNLKLEMLGRGMSWIDAGTSDNFISIANYVQSVQKRQNLVIGCLEEIAYRNNWISKIKLKKIVKNKNSKYFNYLKKIII